MTAHEVARRQLLDASPVHALGVELPIEAAEGRAFPESRCVDPSLQRALELEFGGAGQEPGGEFEVAQ